MTPPSACSNDARWGHRFARWVSFSDAHPRSLTYIAPLCMMVFMKLPKDLVAASAVPLVLSILDEGESYGYTIIQRVHELSGGEGAWTDGTLYPSLHRFEAEGLVRSGWEVSEAGRKRKYYALTASGRRALAEQKEQWHVVHAVL